MSSKNLRGLYAHPPRRSNPKFEICGDGACFSGAEMGGFKRFGGGGGNKELSERKMYLSRSISPTVGPTNWQSRLVPRGATALATLISQGATALVSATALATLISQVATAPVSAVLSLRAPYAKVLRLSMSVSVVRFPVGAMSVTVVRLPGRFFTTSRMPLCACLVSSICSRSVDAPLVVCFFYRVTGSNSNYILLTISLEQTDRQTDADRRKTGAP
jgi:hypothetical protein